LESIDGVKVYKGEVFFEHTLDFIRSTV
jgi:hypothetical protein